MSRVIIGQRGKQVFVARCGCSLCHDDRVAVVMSLKRGRCRLPVYAAVTAAVDVSHRQAGLLVHSGGRSSGGKRVRVMKNSETNRVS